MNIYDILIRDAKRLHYAKRYFRFISECVSKNKTALPEYTEKHHILPRELYPEFSSFRSFSWNCAKLTYRQHIIAHWILWKAYDSPGQAKAFFMMCNSNKKLPSRRQTHLYSISRAIVQASARVGYCGYLDPTGGRVYCRTDDPRVLSGELTHHQSGKAYYRDSNDTILWLRVDDPRVLSGEVIPSQLGRNKSEVGAANIRAGIERTGPPAKDPTTNKSLGRIPASDPRWKTGEIVGMYHGMVVVKDTAGNILNVYNDDPRYLSGELVPFAKGMTTTKDFEGNRHYVSVNDPRYLSGELVSVCSGIGVYQNKAGEIKKLSTSDPLVLSGEYYSIAIGKACYLDSDGNKHYVSTNDARIITGELKSMISGIGIYKDSKGNTIKLPVDDPRVLSGEVVGHTSGMAPYKDSKGNIELLSIDDPRVLSGEFVGVNKGRKQTPEEVAKRKLALISAGRQAKLSTDGTPIGQIPLDDPRWKTGEIVLLRIDLNNPRRRKRSA